MDGMEWDGMGHRSDAAECDAMRSDATERDAMRSDAAERDGERAARESLLPAAVLLGTGATAPPSYLASSTPTT